ncbi:MAG: methylmalonyl-CoA epimerase [candidate division Zixibacteria bacterium]|nr:methylmalonyl-CoA epimerase [candidate division Zixibacteria bacterium]
MNRNAVSHVGIAVVDLDEAVLKYAGLLGSNKHVVTEVSDQKVKVAMFAPDDSGATRIELLAATSPDSPIAKYLKKRGEGLHHICIYVDDIDSRLAELKSAGVRLIDETPRIGAEGNRIAFVHPSGANGVLIELEERPK